MSCSQMYAVESSLSVDQRTDNEEEFNRGLISIQEEEEEEEEEDDISSFNRVQLFSLDRNMNLPSSSPSSFPPPSSLSLSPPFPSSPLARLNASKISEEDNVRIDYLNLQVVLSSAVNDSSSAVKGKILGEEMEEIDEVEVREVREHSISSSDNDDNNCLICLEDISASNFISLACEHSSCCRSCLRDYLLTQKKNRQCRLSVCVFPGCQVLISDADVHSIMPSVALPALPTPPAASTNTTTMLATTSGQLHETAALGVVAAGSSSLEVNSSPPPPPRSTNTTAPPLAVRAHEAMEFIAARKAEIMDYDPMTRFCANPSCSSIHTIDNTYFSTISRLVPITCNDCNTNLCRRCLQPPHFFSSCDLSGRARLTGYIRANSNIIRPCPACGIIIEKNGGCSHMTCNQCHHQFCWECVRPWGSKHSKVLCKIKKPWVVHMSQRPLPVQAIGGTVCTSFFLVGGALAVSSIPVAYGGYKFCETVHKHVKRKVEAKRLRKAKAKLEKARQASFLSRNGVGVVLIGFPNFAEQFLYRQEYADGNDASTTTCSTGLAGVRGSGGRRIVSRLKKKRCFGGGGGRGFFPSSNDSNSQARRTLQARQNLERIPFDTEVSPTHLVWGKYAMHVTQREAPTAAEAAALMSPVPSAPPAELAVVTSPPSPPPPAAALRSPVPLISLPVELLPPSPRLPSPPPSAHAMDPRAARAGGGGGGPPLTCNRCARFEGDFAESHHLGLSELRFGGAARSPSSSYALYPYFRCSHEQPAFVYISPTIPPEAREQLRKSWLDESNTFSADGRAMRQKVQVFDYGNEMDTLLLSGNDGGNAIGSATSEEAAAAEACDVNSWTVVQKKIEKHLYALSRLSSSSSTSNAANAIAPRRAATIRALAPRRLQGLVNNRAPVPLSVGDSIITHRTLLASDTNWRDVVHAADSLDLEFGETEISNTFRREEGARYEGSYEAENRRHEMVLADLAQSELRRVAAAAMEAEAVEQRQQSIYARMERMIRARATRR